MGFTPKKQNASNFNNGNEYTKDSKLSYSDINNLIEGMLWVQENQSTSISLQSKSVTPTEAQQTITYDTGYNGLSTVTVNPIPTDYVKPSGSKTITLNGTYDITKFEEVIVSVSTTADLGQYTYPTTITTNGQHTIDGLFGYSSVLFDVNVPVEANLKSQQQIEIKTSELGANYITTYNASDYGYDGFKQVYIKNLYVKDLSLTDSNVDFGQEENVSFETTVDDGMYKTVIITKPQNLIPSNIVSGQTIFGVTGTHECETTVTVNVQPTKTAIPSKEEQTIKPDDGYNALAQVVVEKIPDEYIKIDENKGLSITENNTYDVKEYAYVVVDVPTTEIKTEKCNVSFSVYAQTIEPQSGYYFDTVNVPSIDTVLETYSDRSTYKDYKTLTPSEGYFGFKSVEYPVPVVKEGTYSASLDFSNGKLFEEISCTGSENTAYDFLSSITIYKPNDLTADNIKSGTNIFGVIGTYTTETFTTEEYKPDTFPYLLNGVRTTASGSVDTVTITPTNSDGFNPITLNIPTVITGELGSFEFPENGVYEYSPEGANFFDKVRITKDGNLKSENILSGVTIYGVEGSIDLSNYLEKKEGAYPTIEENGTYDDIGGYGSVTVQVPTKTVSGPQEYDLNKLNLSDGQETFYPENGADGIESVTITADKDALAGKIKKGETIAGIAGTYELTSENLVEKDVTSLDFSEGNHVVTATETEIGFKQVTIYKPSTLIESNIKAGTKIAGITGTLGSDLQEIREVTLQPGQTIDIYPETNETTGEQYLGMRIVRATVEEPEDLVLPDLLNHQIGTSTLLYNYGQVIGKAYLSYYVCGVILPTPYYPKIIVVPEHVIPYEYFGNTGAGSFDNTDSEDIKVRYISSEFSYTEDDRVKEKLNKITTIILSPSVECVHINSFGFMPNLKTIIMLGIHETPITVTEDDGNITEPSEGEFFEGLNASDMTLYVKTSTMVDMYKGTVVWKEISNIVAMNN